MTTRRLHRLSEVCEMYLEDCSRRLAPSTLNGYRTSLNVLIRVLRDPWIHTLRIEDIDDFLGYLREPHFSLDGVAKPPISNSTYNEYVLRLKPFIRWAHGKGYIRRDFSPLLKRVRETSTVKQMLSQRQIADLLNASSIPRTRALVALAYFAAAHNSEIRNLRVSDVDFERDVLRLPVFNSDEVDELPIGPELHQELAAWLDYYGREVMRTAHRRLEPTDFLIPAQSQRKKISHWTQDDDGVRFTLMAGRLRPTSRATSLGGQIAVVLASLEFDCKGEALRIIRRSSARHIFDDLIATGNYDATLRLIQSLLHHKKCTTTEKLLGISPQLRERDEFMRSAVLLGPHRTPKQFEPGTLHQAEAR